MTARTARAKAVPRWAALFLVAVAGAGSSCSSARIELGTVPSTGGADGGCPSVSGSYRISDVVGSCGGLAVTAGAGVEVRREACGLIFPGALVEGAATYGADGRWTSPTLRIGSTTAACTTTFLASDRSLELGCGASGCFIVLVPEQDLGGTDGGAAAAARDGGVLYSAFTYAGSYDNIVVQKSDFARDLCVRLVLFRQWPIHTSSFVLPPGWGVVAAELRDRALDCVVRVPRPAAPDGGVAVKNSGILGEASWPDAGPPIPCTMRS